MGLLDGTAKKQIIPYVTATGINLDDVDELITILENAFDDPGRV